MATTKATTLAHTLGGISSDISTAEINRLDGVTGDLQTQLDAKAPKASPTFTGTITAPNDSISGDAVSGGTIGAGTFNGTIGSSATGFGLLTNTDQWRYDTDYGSGSGFLTSQSNFQKFTTSGTAEGDAGRVGNGMSNTGGVFTFPTPGIWLIMCKATFQATSGGILYAGIHIYATVDNSNYNERSRGYSNMDDTGYYQSHHNMYMFNCQSTSTHKVKFKVDVSSSTAKFRGASTFNYNEFTFIRLGDS